MRASIRHALVSCLLCLPLAPLEAQFEGLLGNITDLSLMASCWKAPGNANGARCLGRDGAFGLEVIWRLRELGLGKSTTEQPEPKEVRRLRTVRGEHAASAPPSGDTSTVRDTTLSPRSVEETTEYLIQPPTVDRARYVILELALGYSQFSGLTSADASFELRGTVREYPALSVYASFDRFLPFITPYIGARSGLIDIAHLQAVESIGSDSTRVYAASPRAFQFGAVVGLSVGPQLAPLRVEYAYHSRSFASLQWSGATVIPSRLPREITFSGWTLSAGIQISLRDLKH